MDNDEIINMRDELYKLRKEILIKEERLVSLQQQLQEEQHESQEKLTSSTSAKEIKLTNEDIERYSRQLILPGFGVTSQLKLKQTSFLIVGMGGLGCPAAQYLNAAGCGRLGLVDYDVVERSNFHRQTLHTDSRVGMSKVESAKLALLATNPQSQIDCHMKILKSENTLELINKYDVVLDCTDNIATRYLLNDACVMLKKPLVSGSALQMDGQLTVYNYGELGPCYRCLYPVPPPPETVTNCGDGGVMGAITGTIGSLQALEAIKVAVGLGDVLAGRLLVFDGLRLIFRNIKLRARRIDCDVCSPKPFITRLIDYEQFCGMPATDKNIRLNILPSQQRYTVLDYKKALREKREHLLLDVRQPAEFEICKLPNAINVPLKQILDDSYLERFLEQLSKPDYLIFMLCRRGNDSQLAVDHMRNRFPDKKIFDIVGGLHAWHSYIDENFPIY